MSRFFFHIFWRAGLENIVRYCKDFCYIEVRKGSTAKYYLLPVSAPAKQIPYTSGYAHGHIKWRVVAASSILDRRQNIIRKLAFYSDLVFFNEYRFILDLSRMGG